MSATTCTSNSFHLPLVDVSPYLEDPKSAEAARVIENIRSACVSTGFFELIGHGIPPSLQEAIFRASAKFFRLPQEEKQKLVVFKNIGFRGYDAMAAQSYEDDVLPDLKEGFIAGTDISPNDPRVAQRRFFMGQNVWPPKEKLPHEQFKDVVEEYYSAMTKLCWTVLDMIAGTLPYGPTVFDEFKANDPACPLRLLHYPPTVDAKDETKRQLGISAHTDFGAITLLLQDHHEGLQVMNNNTGEWVAVPPRKDAFVVNMGDMMSKITGGEYKSSLHRVINRNAEDRYSVVYFFDGNLDYKLNDLSKPADGQLAPTVEEHMEERRRTTYGLK